ncbi:hypothetical protein AC08_2526 [Escherichia coli 4-203-08_S3_C1]|nr:hypothetical protein AD45_2738 [Escherichia coli 4-203-08_S4_C3]KEL17352.1 hypothetical protein AC08_2526 [Escherichia coli 4-203-08_S3_C1]
MGKGGGKAHTPREAKDNLKSTQMMSVIDAIGEGPIEGPVKSLQSILVNKTPLTDTDGNPVIHGVTAVWRAGEQEQTPPEGFESSGSETVLGVEVTRAKPVTRTITSANIDRLRVTFGVQSLVETTSKGDRNPSSVRLLIQLQRNGNWVTEKDVTINGKTTSQFLASVILDNLPPRPFNIRMVRETADSTTDQLQNRTLWSSYTEIIDVKQCYPNTAIVGMQVDAEQFGGQQMTVNYHKGKEILAVRNAASNEYGGINCEVQFEDAVNEKGEQVWLPYTATETDNTEHGKALWSGLTAGTYGSVSAFVATEAVLEAAKAAKREEINIWRDVQENMEYMMEFNGRNWDYGKKTLSRISMTRLMAENNRLPEGFAWTDGDNNVVPVTAADIIALSDATEQAMFAKGVEINTRQLQMKAEVEALTELKAIRSYVVGWPAG